MQFTNYQHITAGRLLVSHWMELQIKEIVDWLGLDFLVDNKII